MIKIVVAAVSIYVFTGCIDTGVCSRCLLSKSAMGAEISPIPTSVATSVSPAPERTGIISKGYVIKFIDKFPEVVIYILVSILAAFIFNKTGRVNGFMSYITTQIYDRCSSGKRRVLAIINSIIWRNRK